MAVDNGVVERILAVLVIAEIALWYRALTPSYGLSLVGDGFATFSLGKKPRALPSGNEGFLTIRMLIHMTVFYNDVGDGLDDLKQREQDNQCWQYSWSSDDEK